MVENDCDIAEVSVPWAKLNTTATSKATNARIAPYSVIPCPDSSDTKFLKVVIMDLIPPGLDRLAISSTKVCIEKLAIQSDSTKL